MQIGDTVEWTVSKVFKSGKITISQKLGKIESMAGDVATVKTINGRKRHRFHVDQLHLHGSGPNQLTKALLHHFGH